MECVHTVPDRPLALQSTSSMECVHTVPGHLLYSLPLAWSVLVLDTRSPVAQSTHINNRNSHETIRRWLFMEKTKCYFKDSRHKNPHPARKRLTKYNHYFHYSDYCDQQWLGDASHRKSVIQLPGVYLPDEVSEGGGQEKHVGLKPSDCALQPCRLHMIATEENQATSRTCLKVPHMILPQMFNSRHRHDFTVNWSYPFHISLTDTAETVGHQIEKQIWVGKRKKGKNCDSLKSKIATYTNSNK